MTTAEYCEKRSNLFKMLAEFQKTFDLNLKELEDEFIRTNQKAKIGVVYELVNVGIGPDYAKRFRVKKVKFDTEASNPQLRVYGVWLREQDNKPLVKEDFPEFWLSNPALFQISENQDVGTAAPKIPRG